MKSLNFIKKNYFKENLTVFRNSALYSKFYRKMFFLRRNNYFKRLHQIIFSSFYLKKIDLKMIVNAISFELTSLRKGHKYYFKQICSMLNYFFDIKKLKGLLFIMKGRIILRNRQTPRKKKFVLRLGKNNLLCLNSILIEEDSIAYSRLGIINLKMVITLNKEKTFIFNNANNLQKIVNSNFFLLLNKNKNNFLYKSSIFFNKYCLIIQYFLNFRLYLEKFLLQTKKSSNLIIKKKVFDKKENYGFRFKKYNKRSFICSFLLSIKKN